MTLPLRSLRNRHNLFLDPDEILVDSVSELHSEYAPESKLARPPERIYIILFLGVILAGIGYLSLRAVDLQLWRGEDYLSLSQENRFITRQIFPARGVIYDKNGYVLAENSPSFGVVFEKDSFLAAGGNLRELVGRLVSLLGRSEEFFFDRGFPRNYEIDLLPPSFVIENDILPERFVSIATELNFLPGIRIFESYRRIYQDPWSTFHVVGFVGKPSREDLSSKNNLQIGDLVGKSGVEVYYDSVLRGRGGRKIVEVNAKGRETRFKLIERPQEGKKIRLTVDRELQSFIYETLDHYTNRKKGGSVVVLNPRSGAVLALVSFPATDNNQFGGHLLESDFETILKDPLKPLFNRPISGEYPAGSTIKPLFAAAALEEKIIDPNKRIYDEGFISIPNPYKPEEKSIFLDWRRHGWINFYDAIALSANIYFYMIGGGYAGQEGLGITRLEKYAKAFGLGSRLGIDLYGEKSGLIPSVEWKRVVEPYDPVWRVGDTYNVSIGQGGVKVTPLQIASLTSVIANGGTLYKPYLLSETLDADSKSVQKSQPQVIKSNIVSSDNLKQVVRGMRQTVTSGTARLLGSLPASVGAKTGTAQVGKGVPPHAWVTAFAPVENPEVVLTVMIENAGEGSTVAVPIARDILNRYFSGR